MVVALAFHDDAPFAGITTQSPACVPRAELNVSVATPEAVAPAVVLNTIMPPVSVDPVWSVHDAPLVPMFVLAQVGAEPPGLMWAIVETPVALKVVKLPAAGVVFPMAGGVAKSAKPATSVAVPLLLFIFNR